MGTFIYNTLELGEGCLHSHLFKISVCVYVCARTHAHIRARKYVCMCACHLYVGVLGGPKKVLDPLKLEFPDSCESPDMDAGN